MTDGNLRDLLSVLPDGEEIALRAGRARRRALARLEEAQPAWRWWRWAACLAPGPAVLALAVLLHHAWRIEPLAWTPPAPQVAAAELRAPAPAPVRRPRLAPQAKHLEVRWVLSDGTRVQWTFDPNFNL